MRRFLLPLLAAGFLVVASPAQAVTLRDIVDLTKAGLGDEVLLALIEVDGSIFPMDKATVATLKEAGVSERVISALIRSGRAPSADAAVSAATDQVPVASDEMSVTEPAPPDPSAVSVAVSTPVTVVNDVRDVLVPVPYYVAVPVVVDRPHGPRNNREGERSGDGVRHPVTSNQKASSGKLTDRPGDPGPRYWGSGGKRRPDAWKDPD